MIRLRARTAVCITAILLFATTAPVAGQVISSQPGFRGALLSHTQTDGDSLERLKDRGLNAVALLVANAAECGEAATRIRRAGFALYYWLEIGRNRDLADAHPEWMASIQGHSEWRRLFPQPPDPGLNEVVKTYPWTPILYSENFDTHLDRVRRLLAPLPKPDGVFLNDLQGAPSACGCGNGLCRWTTDYGPVAPNLLGLFAHISSAQEIVNYKFVKNLHRHADHAFQVSSRLLILPVEPRQRVHLTNAEIAARNRGNPACHLDFVGRKSITYSFQEALLHDCAATIHLDIKFRNPKPFQEIHGTLPSMLCCQVLIYGARSDIRMLR